MKNENYYVYCKGILGVKTNVLDFKWIYGSVAPTTSSKEYEKCVLKFDVCIKSEKDLCKIDHYDKKFQAYTWNNDSKTIFYRRTFFLNFEIGYNIKIIGNTVFAEIGEHYYKFIKNRTMNLHGIYYLLSDLANIMLLNNGFLTLYASAVYFEPLKKCVVFFAPPNTGKTFTAANLSKLSEYMLVGEDIVVSDGEKIYSCPWTSSYRKNNKFALDSAGSLRRIDKSLKTDICEECNLTDLAVLSLGEKRVDKDQELIIKQISMLNGYLFNYYSSPIVKILGYFDDKYCKAWYKYSDTMLENMLNNSNYYLIQSKKTVDFGKIIHSIVSGKEL